MRFDFKRVLKFKRFKKVAKDYIWDVSKVLIGILKDSFAHSKENNLIWTASVKVLV